MKLLQNQVYRLLTLNMFLIFVVLLLFWPVWPAIKLTLLYTFLFFLPGLSIMQNLPLHWLERFALASVVGMSFPIVYAIWNILGFKLSGVLYVIVPLLVLITGMYWHQKKQ